MSKFFLPHDKMFRETFGDLDVTTDFMQNYLPQEILDIIDIDTLALQNGSYIESELRDSYSDLLFHAQIGGEEGYLYFLFEHKSYKAEDIAFQLLGYMHQIWGQYIYKEKAETLPIIIPILFYHGESNWQQAKKISDWIGGYHQFPASIQKYVPDYDFLYYNFSKNSGEEVKGNPKLQAYLELSRYIFIKDMETFLEAMTLVDELLHGDDSSYYDTVLIYILSVRNDLPFETVKERLSIEGRKRFMSIAEKLRSEGMEEGKKENSIKVAKKLLQLKIDEQQIREATDLTAEQIEEIKKEL